MLIDFQKAFSIPRTIVKHKLLDNNVNGKLFEII